MYCEQMMREQGFDDAPSFRLALHTDAIWRACRIILDVRMHRGEISVDEAIDFLVEHTGFERAERARRRSTATPTRRPTSCRYLLGKVAPPAAARRRAATARRRLLAEGASTTRCSGRAACRSASTGGCWRARAAARSDATADAGHPEHRPRGRPLAARLLAGRRDRGRRADRSTGADRRAHSSSRAPGSSTSSTSTVPSRRSRATWRRRAVSRGGRRAAPARRRRRGAGADPARVRRRRDAGGRARVAVADEPEPAARLPAPSPATGWRSGSTRGRSAWPRSLAPPRAADARRARRRAGRRRRPTLRPVARRRRARSRRACASSARSFDVDLLVAGGVTDLAGIARLRDAGVAGVILGEPLLSGALDFPAALEAAA